jgi:Predicted membrane protein (DUF2085)
VPRPSIDRETGRILPVAAVLWAGLLLAAPSLSSLSGGWAYLSASVYWLGALVCHQRPERSFHVWGGQLPVCARCTGLYLAAAAGVVFTWIRAGRHRAVAFGVWRRRLLVSAVPTAATLVVEWWWPATDSRVARAVAAIPLGLVAGALLTESMSFRGRLEPCERTRQSG